MEVPAAQMGQLIEDAPANASKRLWIEGTNLDGKDIRKGVLLPLGEKGTARVRMASAGVNAMVQGDAMLITQVKFGSRAEKLGMEQGFKIVSAEVPAQRPDKEWMFLPAIALLLLVVTLQRARGRRTPAASPVSTRPA
jgi:hypothetical protein